MGKAYSVDLRLRVLAALDNGLGKMQAHKTFQVSRSTIDDWVRLRAATGSVQVAARQQRERRGLVNQEGFAAFVQRHGHSTLEQMRQAWQQQTQQTLSTMSFSRALRQHGYTRKKRVICTASGAPPSERSSRSS
jgi:transposase